MKKLMIWACTLCLLLTCLVLPAGAAYTNEEAIWNYFKAQGFSDAGVAAIMGNLEAESSYLPNNVEQTANVKSGVSDQEFVAAVDAGEITREEFISSERFGVCTSNPDGQPRGREYGFGLAQWTYSTRKAALYDFAQARGTSIADLGMQLDFMMVEMSASLKDYIAAASDVEEACVKFHNIYEGSSDTAEMIAGRVGRAERILKQYGTTAPVEPVTPADPEPAVRFPRVAAYVQGQFADVAPGQWFTQSTADAVELGLMKGAGGGLFNPYGNVTLAEAVTMATRIHSIYTTGGDTFVQAAGDAWYQVYLNYACEQGILGLDSYGGDPALPVTRAQYAEIFAKALPAEALPGKNNVADNSIPDVSLSDPWADAVYTLYRAGILSGGDGQGTFSPTSYITRAESAAVVSRMADPGLRLTISLP